MNAANTATWTNVPLDAYAQLTTGSADLKTSPPVYYTFTVGEYCNSPALIFCNSQSAATTAYPYPAYVRWCPDYQMKNCQAVYAATALGDGKTYTTARTPGITSSVPGSNNATTVQSSTTSYAKASARLDCAGATCTYEEEMTNDFTLYGKDRHVELHSRDLDGWKITFVDTGLHSNIGQRLLRVRKYVENEEMFLANYTDGLSDLPLNRQIREFEVNKAVTSLVAVRSSQSVHAVRAGHDGVVTNIGAMGDQQFWVNGGFFIMRPDIFKYIHEGEELVGHDPLQAALITIEHPLEHLFGRVIEAAAVLLSFQLEKPGAHHRRESQ